MRRQFNPDKMIAKLVPIMEAIITEAERQRAEEMLEELENSYFEVVLIPASEQKHTPHYIRALESPNPVWYSRYCSLYTNIRGIGRKRMKRPRTYIKRSDTIRALKNLLRGRVTPNVERLLDFIREEQKAPEKVEAYAFEEFNF